MTEAKAKAQALQVARAIGAWKDTRITKRLWEAMFPQSVRDEARHAMSVEELRIRG